MLAERGLIQGSKAVKDTIESLEDKVDKDGVSQSEYSVKLDKGEFHVKISPIKITTVSKTSDIANFLKKYPKAGKILVVDAIGKKAIQYIRANYEGAEVFTEEEMMINIVEHVSVPKHVMLTEDEIKQFYEEFNTKKKGMPRILTGDPIARYYNMKPNDVVKILRPSGASGVTPFYRLVVKGEMKKK